MESLTNSSVSGVDVKRRYAYWRELLQQWCFLVERVYRVTGGNEAVYCYRERCNVGLLASAAATNGWVALEECALEKYIEGGSQEVYRGRADLRIWRDRRYHEVEAKFARLALSNSAKTPRFDKASEKALEDASRSVATGARVDRKVAVAFVVPTIPATPKRDIPEERIDQFRDLLVNRIRKTEPAFMAWSFPGPAKASGSVDRMALGIVLFGKEPPKA